jgi:hypothetical protein
MPTDKKAVVEYLFFSRWDPSKEVLKNAVVTLAEVSEAIRHCNSLDGKRRSDSNPANFMKDIIRGHGASKQWPDSLKKLKYTAVQRTAEGRSFEFIQYEAGQAEPFPDVYKARSGLPKAAIQSLSMRHESKMLGRRDESWLTQTAVNLRIVETHFALNSPMEVIDLVHLQMSVKLRRTEIDAMFMARIQLGDSLETRTAIITCEAKQATERVLESQIVEQVKAAFAETSLDLAIPIAIRAIRGVGIYVVEFGVVERAAAETYTKPVAASEAVYALQPPVNGI